MITKVSNNPEIYKIEVPLEGSPLKNLSSYVLKSQGASLVVDTGFNMPGSFNALSSGLRELNVDMSDKNTVLFLTHVHSDHVGLVPRIAKGCRILMSAKDQAVFLPPSFWRLKRLIPLALSDPTRALIWKASTTEIHCKSEMYH